MRDASMQKANNVEWVGRYRMPGFELSLYLLAKVKRYNRTKLLVPVSWCHNYKR